MKIIHKIFAAAASILALSSCVQDAIGPLTGEYAKPVTYELNTLVKNEVTVDQSTRTFNVVLTDNAATLDMKFVGNKYYLPDNGYTAATADAAKNGTYIVGNGGSTFTVNGNTVGVDSGTLNVKQTDGVYTFKGTLWLADESVIAVNSAVALVYEADPEPVKPLNMADVVTPVADATGAPVAGVEKHNITLTEGEATVAIFELLTAEGADIVGTYTCQEYASAAGLMGNGYSFPDWGVEGGSRYWVDGQLVLINAGETLEVTKDSEGVYKFVGSTGYEFTATAGNGGGNADGAEYVELTGLISLSKNTGLLTINMATEGVTGTYDPATYSTIYSGTGYYLATDIYSADGKLYTGTYNACAVGGTVGEGEFGIGYDTEFFGMQMYNWGTCWWTVNDGATSAEKILDGTMEVSVEGANVVIKLKSTVVNAKFTYPIADLLASDGSAIEVVNLGGSEDNTEYEELTNLISLSKNTGLLTINMATEDVTGTYDPATYSTIYSGTGYYLATDIYSADGKLYTGTYNACAVGGTVGEGEFGIGYDTEFFGMQMYNWGTCWWTVNDGATSAEKILDGTMEVSVEGANVVIKLKSTVVNAKFTYPIADLLASDGSAIEVI